MPDRAIDAPVAGTCYLWPCNVPTFNVWQRIQTQWRVGGMGDKTGLDYASVGAYLRDVEKLKVKEFRDTFIGLQAMELAALKAWAQDRK